MITSRYELRGLLGKGGMSEVHRAWDRHQDRLVAVKIARGTAVDAILHEADVLRRIDHPGVPAFIDAGSQGDQAWLVMEFANGESLETSIERSVFQAPEFAAFTTQMLEVLIAAHGLGVLHLDLKPENIFVERSSDGSMRTKVLDFGIARVDGNPASRPTAVMGSLFYMAPERFDHLPVDGRTDLYALGCVCYFVLTGQCPFQGETSAQVMVAHLRHLLTPLRGMRTDIHPTIASWTEWLMQREPADRPTSAKVALDEFRTCLRHQDQAL